MKTKQKPKGENILHRYKETEKEVPSNEEKDASQTKVSQMCELLDKNLKIHPKHAQSADGTTEKVLTEDREMMNGHNYLTI